MINRTLTSCLQKRLADHQVSFFYVCFPVSEKIDLVISLLLLVFSIADSKELQANVGREIRAAHISVKSSINHAPNAEKILPLTGLQCFTKINTLQQHDATSKKLLKFNKRSEEVSR